MKKKDKNLVDGYTLGYQDGKNPNITEPRFQMKAKLNREKTTNRIEIEAFSAAYMFGWTEARKELYGT